MPDFMGFPKKPLQTRMQLTCQRLQPGGNVNVCACDPKCLFHKHDKGAVTFEWMIQQSAAEGTDLFSLLQQKRHMYGWEKGERAIQREGVESHSSFEAPSHFQVSLLLTVGVTAMAR